ncbi:hypothetical protein [Massilia soli]|uniref:Uncharacterized protein n=1 Tax=Massilia soli TaxID=2792854 RepID=A0ABS7SPS2_9BURK|nr:hypothetical protein [Massilia soli]MBZ2207120.1 hypothetical protein [Massilia soli]
MTEEEIKTRDMKQFQTCRIPEPRRHFLLETPSFSVAIAVNSRLVALFRRVKTGAEWEALGVIPYNIRQFETDPEDWISEGFGKDDFEGIACRFSPVFPTVEKGCARAIRDGGRFVTDFYQALELRRFGVAWQEMSRSSQHVRDAVDACRALENDNVDEAIQLARAAIIGNPRDLRYYEVLEQARLLKGDVRCILDAIAYYANDMSTVAGHADKYLKLAIAEDRYDLMLDFILKVITGVNAEIAGQIDIKRRIYGKQQKHVYVRDLHNFIARISTMRAVLCERLIHANRCRDDDLLKLLDLVETADPKKAKKVSKLRALIHA